MAKTIYKADRLERLYGPDQVRKAVKYFEKKGRHCTISELENHLQNGDQKNETRNLKGLRGRGE